MRDIGPSLLRAQRARSILGKNLLIRVVLTYGANTYTYTTTKIKQLSRTEQVFSHRAQILIEDTDKVLHGLDLEGYKAVISRGLITRAGEEWIDLPPLWVVGQQRDSYRDRLECSLSLEGTFNRMGKHKAESVYTQESNDTNTVKDLLIKIVEATLAPYTNYPAYTITFDSEDDLIDTFIPADSFRVGENDARLAKLKELLGYTDCVARIGNDGAIHIRVPVTSGTTYDNEYTLVEGRDYQNFFNKRFRRRIVSPNYITFKSFLASGDNYTGFAKDASADLTDMLERETHYVRATSNDQCTNLATAYLLKLQMEAEKGSGVLPFVHFGQEIYDYVNFVDARAGDNRAGNVGSISEFYKPGQFNMNLSFGRTLGVLPLQGYATEAGLTIENLTGALFELQEQLNELSPYVEQNQENIKILDQRWKDLRREQSVIWRKTSDETLNNDDTLQDDNQLFFGVLANEIWEFVFNLLYIDEGDWYIKFAITVPAGATLYWRAIDSENEVPTFDFIVNASGESRAFWCRLTTKLAAIQGIVINGATAGNVQLQWAQQFAQAFDTKVLANSHIIAKRIG